MTSIKIMGQNLVRVPQGIDDIELYQIVNFVNERYEKLKAEEDAKDLRKENAVTDTGELRAMAIFDIVRELQTIKGKQEVFIDRNTKKVNDLINEIDDLGLSD